MGAGGQVESSKKRQHGGGRKRQRISVLIRIMMSWQQSVPSILYGVFVFAGVFDVVAATLEQAAAASVLASVERRRRSRFVQVYPT